MTTPNGIDWRIKMGRFGSLLARAAPLADSPEEAIEAVDVAMAMEGAEQLVPPPQPIAAAFSHDAFNPQAQRVLDKALKAVKELSASAGKALRAALKLEQPAEMAQAVVEFVATYRNQLARLLGRTNLAALLEGALEVASKMPPVPLPGLGGPLPVSLPPETATGLLVRLEALPEQERWEAIFELPHADQQAWVQNALELGGTAPPLPPVVLESAGDDDVVFPIIDEAVRNLSERNVLSRYEYDRLDAASRQKAFTVAGAEARETLLKIRDALATNVAEGADLETFREKVLADVEPDTFLSPLHQEQVWRNNVQTAFSDGQMAVLNAPFVRSGFPYAFYHAIHDDRVRPNHLALERLGIQGTNIYRIDDPVFQLFRPPWDYSDRCGWTPCTVQFAAERGIKEAIEWLRTGREPSTPAYVSMPNFRPPPGFDRSLSGAPLSIRLSLEPMDLDAAFGMDAQGNWHGPNPPGPGWVAIAEGPRGGKVWKRGSQRTAGHNPAQGVVAHLKAGDATRAYEAWNHIPQNERPEAAKAIPPELQEAFRQAIQGYKRPAHRQQPSDPKEAANAERQRLSEVFSRMRRVELHASADPTLEQLDRQKRIAADAINGFSDKAMLRLAGVGVEEVFCYNAGSAYVTMHGVTTYNLDNDADCRGVWAHEFAHHVDAGPSRLGRDTVSATPEWKAAWKKEIVDLKRISEYASYNETEGFAEFFRMMDGLGRKPEGRRMIEQAFPTCVAVLEKAGAW